MLEHFLGKVPANDNYNQRLLSTYVTCSGYTSNNYCLERVLCEYSSPFSRLGDEEKDVISM